jgi:hypothetical protein
MTKKILFSILTLHLLLHSLCLHAQVNTPTQSDSKPLPMTNSALRDLMESKSAAAKQAKANQQATAAKTATEAGIEKEINAAKELAKATEKKKEKQPSVAATKKPVCPPVSQPVTINWTSKNSHDVLTISNGSSIKSYLVIVVSGSGKSPGIVLTNCGKVKRVSAGNSVICDTGYPTSPVSFSSDSNAAASGTYAIKTSGE